MLAKGDRGGGLHACLCVCAGAPQASPSTEVKSWVSLCAGSGLHLLASTLGKGWGNTKSFIRVKTFLGEQKDDASSEAT